MLETLTPPPKGSFGDLTGDRGKQVSTFLYDCNQQGLLSKVGSILDVGGQDTSTVSSVSQALNYSSILPSIIIDLSSITPAVTPLRPNIKYAIGDAHRFFLSENYEASVNHIINRDPTLVLFNNMLNILGAKEGWLTLEAAWSRLRSGDYLFISGLAPEELEKYRLKVAYELDGIVEFHKANRLFKSALSAEFPYFIKTRLENASILRTEDFDHLIKVKGRNLNIHSRRLLALRKI